jgi:hypothetical protein
MILGTMLRRRLDNVMRSPRGIASQSERIGGLGDVMANDPPEEQRLHLVFGGELQRLDGTEFKDLSMMDIVGIYPNYAAAYAAWKAKAQRTVDNALMRYFIVHMHRLLDPSNERPGGPR